LPPPGSWTNVCQSDCPLTYLKNHMSKFHEIFSMLHVAVAQSSDDNVIRYVLLFCGWRHVFT